MYDNYNYPEGADTPDAPWNQVEPDYLTFEEEVQYVLTRTAEIESNVYEGGHIDEEGFHEPATYEGELQDDYEEAYLTPLQIMEEYSDLCLAKMRELVAELEHATEKEKREIRRQISHCKNVIDSCSDWEETFEPL